MGPAEASRRSQADVVRACGTSTVSGALALSPASPTAWIVCWPAAVPAGTVTVTSAVPLAGTGLGVMAPLSVGPFGPSSRRVTVCPGEKFVIAPVIVAGSEATDERLRLRAGAATVTGSLAGLSGPRQLALTGVMR